MKKIIICIIVSITMLMLFESCKTTGYGCKGHSKSMTGHKGNGY